MPSRQSSSRSSEPATGSRRLVGRMGDGGDEGGGGVGEGARLQMQRGASPDAVPNAPAS